jgi:hypothetical protein
MCTWGVDLGAADNLEQAIVDFIGGARKSLDIVKGVKTPISGSKRGGLVLRRRRRSKVRPR